MKVGFLNHKGISGQIAALVVASIIAIHLILTATFLIHRPDRPDPSTDHGHAQLATSVQLLGAAAAAERPRLFADIARAFPQLDIASLPPGTAAAATEPDGFNLHGLRHRLGGGYRIFSLEQEEDSRKIGIALPDGAMISAKMLPDQRQRPFWGGPWMMTLLFAVISVTLLGLWAARALAAPLSSFAKAAEDFSLNGAAAPLPEPRPGRNSFGGEGVQPHARADHRPDRRPHQNAGRHQPRSAHPDHPNAAALRIHRGRRPSQPDVAGSRPDAVDAGERAFVSAQRPQARIHDAG
jgi:hypothetical protein